MTNTKKELVDALISNCDCWKEAQREVLNGMGDEQVTKLIEAENESKSLTLVANAASEVLTDTHKFDEKSGKFQPLELGEKVAEEVKGIGTTTPTGTLNKYTDSSSTEKKPQTEAEWLASAPVGIQNVIKGVMDRDTELRKGIVQGLIDNVEGEENQKRVRDLLSSKPLQELEDLALLNVKATQAPSSMASFFGRTGGPATTVNKEEEEVGSLPLPTINWEAKNVN